MAQAADALIGTELAGYRIESFLGRGGMSVVYLAEDLSLGRPVALKLLAARLAEDERFRERFHRESRLAASLDHPNVIPIYEAGEAGGQLYIAMRYVEGVTLGQLLDREGTLEPGRSLVLLGQVASALDAAHARGLVHRDVKPGNVLVTGDDHAYLSDFGLTKRSEGSDSLTDTGGLLGTIDYVAPEQIEGDPVDGRADVYSLTCVLYECLVGEKPFPRDTDLAVLWAHVQDPPPAASPRRSELPVTVDGVLARGLAKDPAERYDSAGELLDATRRALEGVRSSTRTRLAGPARRIVTVVVASADARSAAGGQLDPESLARATGRCLDELTVALERHGGVVEPLPGHGVIAAFGLPVTREDDAVRAVRAADELRSRLERASHELEETAGIRVAARVGLDTGEVVAGEPGTGPGALAGETLNLAARLEESARPGEIVLGRSTHSLVEDSVVSERIDAGPAANGEDAWRLVSLLPVPPALGSRPAAGMVGREGELAELRLAFDQAVETSTCRLALVLGPAGIGKSRLANALAASLEDEATVLAGRCLSYGEGITYWPVGEIVRALAAGSEPVPALRRLLGSEDEGGLAAELVAAAVGLPGGEGSREETFWAIRLLFEAVARTRPLVLVLEDVHWAEPTLLELIEHVARVTRDAPLLLVCLARPDILDTRPELRTVPALLTLELQPLTPAESALLVERLHPAALPAELATRVVEIAEGNPLFLEQFLAMASEEDPASRGLTLPPAIQALLAARLDRLSPEERRLIECGSIEGLVFHVGPLMELCQDVGDVAIWRQLLALMRKDLVRPARSEAVGDEALRFGHALIREAAYQGIAKERRADLHEQFGAFLERTHEHAQTALELEEIVGYHLEQAVQYRREAGAARNVDPVLAQRAAARLAAAGRRALGRLDLPASINLLERAADLLPADSPERALLEIDLGSALTEAGRLEEADRLLAAVEERMATDGRVTANARVQRLFVAYSRDLEAALPDVRRSGEALLTALQAEGDDRGLSRLWLLRGLEQWINGQVANAEAAWQRGAAHAERAGDRIAHADLLGWLASAAYFGPLHVTAGIERCTEIADQLRDLRSMRAQVLHFLAGLHAIAGRFEAADVLFADANAILSELSVTVQWAVSHAEVLAAIQKGDLERAESLLRLGCTRLEEMGERNILPMTVALLARVLYEQGRLDEALASTDRTRELAADPDILAQTIWRGVRARILVRRGALEEAERLAREATHLADSTDYVVFAGDAQLDLADVLERSGKPKGARQAALQALRHYQDKGNNVDAVRARALVDAAEHE
jgi:class 3 adenylate cyclase/tetratricopeptide (TPR) repeat protein/predicted Ser/Thr protein kinase